MEMSMLKTFQDYLRGIGIKHQTIVSFTPEQNGVAECVNITTIMKARSMLMMQK
jgi:hypothetical protein